MKDVDILIFGDSIAYGTGDKELAGWVNRLRLALESRNDANYCIFNLGIPGNTTSSLTNRFRRDSKIRYNPDAHTIIVFAIGINDTQIINKRKHVSEVTFRKNIIKLITMAREYTDNILFVGLTPVDESRVIPVPWNSRISYYNLEISKFNNYLENICRYYDTEYVNVWSLLENKDLEDGLHPNSNGHQKLSEKIYRCLGGF